MEEGVSFAPVTRGTIAAWLEDARYILNECFKDNPIFVTVSAGSFAFQAKDIKWVMDPRISNVVHFEGEPVGAVTAIPGLNPLLERMGLRFGLMMPWHDLRYRTQCDRAIVFFQGVLPRFEAPNPVSYQCSIRLGVEMDLLGSRLMQTVRF